MLYITTRNDKDAFTAHRALTENMAADGGKFVPFHMPAFSHDEVVLFKNNTFGESLAKILNLFFSTRLNGLDVDFAIGRNVLHVVPMHHKILIAELWHNLDGNYESILDNLYKIVLGDESANYKRTEWFNIAARIAILFAIYGQMLNGSLICEDDCFDVCFSSDDLSAQTAAIYAKSMGLPVCMIISTNEEDGNAWDLIHRGSLNPTAAKETLIGGIERLLHAAYGCHTVQKYVDCMSNGRVFSIHNEVLYQLNESLFCSVPGSTRSGANINSVYRSNAYIMTPDTALNFGGLQDYRSKTGESKLSLLFAEQSPAQHIKQISATTGVPAEKLIEMINRS